MGILLGGQLFEVVDRLGEFWAPKSFLDISVTNAIHFLMGINESIKWWWIWWVEISKKIFISIYLEKMSLFNYSINYNI